MYYTHKAGLPCINTSYLWDYYDFSLNYFFPIFYFFKKLHILKGLVEKCDTSPFYIFDDIFQLSKKFEALWRCVTMDHYQLLLIPRLQAAIILKSKLEPKLLVKHVITSTGLAFFPSIETLLNWKQIVFQFCYNLESLLISTRLSFAF